MKKCSTNLSSGGDRSRIVWCICDLGFDANEFGISERVFGEDEDEEIACAVPLRGERN